MRHRLLALLVTAALLTAFAPRVEAGGFTLSTFGSRRNSMGTNIGAPDDLSAIFHNPSGLADQDGHRFHLSIGPTFLSINFALRAFDPERYPAINPRGCGEGGAAPCPWPINAAGFYDREIQPERTFGILPFIAASWDLERYNPKLKGLKLGLSVHTPQAYGAFLPQNAPTAYLIVGGFFLAGSLTPAVAYRINKYVAVGGSVSYNYLQLQLKQRLSTVDAISGRGNPIDPTAQLAQTLLGDILLDYTGVDHGFGWTLSVLVNPTPWLSFGLSYNGNTQAEFEGPVKFTALGIDDQRVLQQALGMVNYKLPKRLKISFPIPQALRFGVNFKVTKWLEIGYDWRIWFYNVYKRQTVTPVYDPNEPGDEPLTKADLTRNKDYSVSWQSSIGVLVRPHPNVSLMTGYSYDQSPIPNHTFTMDNPSLHIHRFTVGVRWQINWRWRLALSYFVNVWVERDITRSQTNPPTNIRGNGISHTPLFEMEYRY